MIIVLAWCGTFFDIIFLIPQLFKIIKTKYVNDLSMFSTFFTLIAGVLWIIYGIHYNEIFLYVSNIFVTLFSLVLIILQILWSKPKFKIRTKNKLIRNLMKLDIDEIENEILILKKGENI
ncbi:SemiSWEET family transporter [Spiroplasma endosymbiont of Stenodema calcarata]|uniref:SemiSWEET family transporter n=1 Tax=Spiroplasma endosymbiont of Stenodema calcarata TaxID=3139328 RepID=UPI003CCAF83D